ncbi:hypothetical protein B0J15DRAFT_554994 [Fusarium solani]|uniref:Uncharacterized protein n=1 Tax=Fusarium solani TaxID=169388 RepID=A0A9P9G792_FUSSL|nr:uncharacterized protein B0J15DRAFT_554994 [Fusarium solani]KAH7234123.1 hypothetical protein B0J15DRAFT_554994 [Fusarium solani]
MASSTETTCYYLVPNLQALDPSAREVDASAYTWVQPTIIEDEDLTFGGKALSTWYEEERRRLSSGSDEEERRGRERVRRNYSRSSKSHKKRVKRHSTSTATSNPILPPRISLSNRQGISIYHLPLAPYLTSDLAITPTKRL